MDGAGWHTEDVVKDFDNVSIIKLPSYLPELNATKQVWSWMRRLRYWQTQAIISKLAECSNNLRRGDGGYWVTNNRNCIMNQSIRNS